MAAPPHTPHDAAAGGRGDHPPAATPPARLEGAVWRWAAPNRHYFGLQLSGGQIAKRFATLEGSQLSYWHSAADQAARPHDPPKSWTVLADCRLSAIVPCMHHHKGALAGGQNVMLYTLTVTWPAAVPVPGVGSRKAPTASLQLGFEREEAADAWHAALAAVIDAQTPAGSEAGDADHAPYFSARPTPSPTAGPEALDSDRVRPSGGSHTRSMESVPGVHTTVRRAEDGRRWVTVQHINGVRVLKEEEPDRGQKEREPPVYMMCCVMRDEPQKVFDALFTEEVGTAGRVGDIRRLASPERGGGEEGAMAAQFTVHPGGTGAFHWLLGKLVGPRSVCVQVTWRQDEDGTYVLLISPGPCADGAPPAAGTRMALHAALTVAPLKPEYRSEAASHESLLTIVVKFNPGGGLGPGYVSALLDTDSMYVEHAVDWMVAIKDQVEQNRFMVDPMKKGAESDEEWYDSAQEVKDAPALNATAAVTTLAASVGQMFGASNSASAGLAESPGPSKGAGLAAEPTLDARYWSCPGADGFKLRGGSYLEDKVKYLAGEPHFDLRGLDLFEAAAPTEHVARYLGYVAEERDSFFYIVNLMVPGPPFLTLAIAFAKKGYAPGAGATPFDRCMGLYADGPDEVRNDIFKLIPKICEGSWIIQKSVGSQPCLLGRKLRQVYYRGPNYIETDIDIASSKVAAAVVGLVAGATKTVTVDMAFLCEGQTEETLPEELIGTVRLARLDLGEARPLPQLGES